MSALKKSLPWICLTCLAVLLFLDLGPAKPFAFAGLMVILTAFGSQRASAIIGRQLTGDTVLRLQRGLIPWWVCVPAVAIFASFIHELEHDLIHQMYFRSKPWANSLMLLLGWLAVEAEHKRIERDLQERTGAELAKAGLTWAQTAFQGRDGMLSGVNIDATVKLAKELTIPVIASGGVGTLEHLYDGLVKGKAEAVLAASIFHYRTHTIQQAKAYLRDRGVPVRVGAA